MQYRCFGEGIGSRRKMRGWAVGKNTIRHYLGSGLRQDKGPPAHFLREKTYIISGELYGSWAAPANRPNAPRCQLKLFDAREREKPQGRQYPAFDQGNARIGREPIAKDCPREFRPPAKLGAAPLEKGLNPSGQPITGAEVIDEYDLAARFYDPRHFIETGMRFRDNGQNIGRDYGIKMRVRESEPQCVHNYKAANVAQAVGAHPLFCTPQHWFRKVDARYLGPRPEHGQFEPGSDADVEHFPADAANGSGRCLAPGPQYKRKDEIIDGRPACVGVLYMIIVENSLFTQLHSGRRQGRCIKNFLSHERALLFAVDLIFIDSREGQSRLCRRSSSPSRGRTHAAA